MRRPSATFRAVAAALVCTAQGLLPVSMLGGLAVQIQRELALDEQGLGAAVTVFFAVSAVGSAPAGRLLQRIGPYPGMAATAALSAVALVGIATAATSWTVLVGFLIVAGMGNAIAQPAANLLLASGVPHARQGLLFGIKQAAVPVTTLLAGLSVPALGLTVGWRWAFVLAVAGSAALPLLAPRRAKVPRARDEVVAPPTVDRWPLVVVAGAGFLGAAAVNAMAVFLVASAVATGIAPSAAGLLLAFGSVLGITTRVAMGWAADRRDGRHLRVVSQLLVAGAVGFTLLALGTPAALYVVGTVVAFGAGWGWNGLFTFAVVRSYPAAAATATGITQTGLWLGGMVGPLAFGVIASRASFAAAWLAGAVVMVLAAGTCLVGRHLIMRARTRRAEPAERALEGGIGDG
ncbi:MAG: MFS transporter [Euzebyales bacterium]|nr:MFS transporter [Euzebyales bacterium]